MVKVFTAPFACWADAFWIVNDSLEMIVAPSVNRIVKFGPRNGDNLLWIDPDADRGSPTQWINWGGEKLWFWPQEQWPSIGAGWPPPMDPGAPGKILEHSGGIDWLIPGTDLFPAIRREIRMNETCIEVRSSWEGATSAAKDFALWSVTQIPAPPRIHIGDLHSLGGWHWMQEEKVCSPQPNQGGWSWSPERSDSSKCGFAAGMLSDARLVLRSAATKNDTQASHDWRTCGAQVYFDTAAPLVRPPNLPRYAELEFLAQGSSEPLLMTWSLA